MRDGIKFLSSHGVVEAHLGDCVSLTFGMSKKNVPHTPVKRSVCKSLTTMCDHDIGVVVYPTLNTCGGGNLEVKIAIYEESE